MRLKNPDLIKILLVEDEVYMQILIRTKLNQYFDLHVCSDGLEALAFLQEGELPDLIISDLNLPQVSGLELISQLKSTTFFNAIPIIILSGEENSDIRIKCLNQGADDFIVKPFNPDELLARIKAVLRRIGI